MLERLRQLVRNTRILERWMHRDDLLDHIASKTPASLATQTQDIYRGATSTAESQRWQPNRASAFGAQKDTHTTTINVNNFGNTMVTTHRSNLDEGGGWGRDRTLSIERHEGNGAKPESPQRIST